MFLHLVKSDCETFLDFALATLQIVNSAMKITQFSTTFRRVLAQAGESVTSLSAKIGTSAATLWGYARARNRPARDVLAKLAFALPPNLSREMVEAHLIDETPEQMRHVLRVQWLDAIASAPLLQDGKQAGETLRLDRKAEGYGDPGATGENAGEEKLSARPSELGPDEAEDATALREEELELLLTYRTRANLLRAAVTGAVSRGAFISTSSFMFKPESDIFVRFLKEKPKDAFTLDANFVYDWMRKKYQLEKELPERP